MRCRVFCSILGLILIVSVGVVLVPALLTRAAEDPASPGRAPDPNVGPGGDLPVPGIGQGDQVGEGVVEAVDQGRSSWSPG